MITSHILTQKDFLKLAAVLDALGFQVPKPEYYPVGIQLQFSLKKMVEDTVHVSLTKKGE